MESGSRVPQTSVAPGSNLISANTRDIDLAPFFPLKMQRLSERGLAGCAQHTAELGEQEGHPLKDTHLRFISWITLQKLELFPSASASRLLQKLCDKWRTQMKDVEYSELDNFNKT